jgi:RHH-type transcriptional regulator, rel operon repressor / antitoxin RelB
MSTQKVSVSFRTEKSKVKQLDALAKQQRRDRTQLIDEAIENYLEIQRWHLQEIEAGIREADAGGFASEQEVRVAFERLLK